MSKLVPVVCKSEVQVMDASYSTGRRRPVVALNAKGEMVVCCKRTARRMQMQIEARLFVRPRKNADLSALLA
jgi:uncharacterized metal-binding protein YceD (DUF177 family)